MGLRWAFPTANLRKSATTEGPAQKLPAERSDTTEGPAQKSPAESEERLHRREEAEEELRERVKQGSFAVALSGGGHRATLATLGALLAIVDRGLGPKVLQVASVSGGSITSAFVGQRVDLGKLEPYGLDPVAQQLATSIIRKGVLTRAWIVMLVGGSVGCGAIAATTLAASLLPWWIAAFVGLLVAVVLFAGRGQVVEWLLDRRYFRPDRTSQANRPLGAGKLSSLSGNVVEHVFCATDLALGLPVYASSGAGGMVWRRRLLSARDFKGFQTFDGGDQSIAGLVRASAAFPGIPPRRIPMPRDPKFPSAPRVAFLADGGLWNNLGTQVLREDGFLGRYGEFEDGVLRPYFSADGFGIPLLCFNGSAPLKPSRPFVYRVPGLALAMSLLRVASILSANTVTPRVEAMLKEARRRVLDRERPTYLSPANLVADLRPVKQVEQDYEGRNVGRGKYPPIRRCREKVGDRHRRAGQ